MRDQRMHLLGMASGQVRPDGSLAATAEHQGRLGTQILEQTMGAVRVDLLLCLQVIERATRETAAVVGHDCVLVGELVGDTVEAADITTAGMDQQQDRARAAYLIVEVRSLSNAAPLAG